MTPNSFHMPASDAIPLPNLAPWSFEEGAPVPVAAPLSGDDDYEGAINSEVFSRKLIAEFFGRGA